MCGICGFTGECENICRRKCPGIEDVESNSVAFKHMQMYSFHTTLSDSALKECQKSNAMHKMCGGTIFHF